MVLTKHYVGFRAATYTLACPNERKLVQIVIKLRVAFIIFVDIYSAELVTDRVQYVDIAD